MKKMKYTRLGYLMVFLIITASAFAQKPINHQDMSEKYYAQKIAFITNELELTPEESTLFWPYYNEYNNKKDELHAEIMQYKKDLRGKYATLSEEDAEKALLFYQEHIRKMNQLEIEYQNKYLEVIPATKVLSLLKAENDFRRQMLKKLGRKRRGQ